MTLLVRAGIPVCALAAGAIAAAVGVRGALWVLMTCFALSAALLATPAIRSARNLPPRPAAAARAGPARKWLRGHSGGNRRAR